MGCVEDRSGPGALGREPLGGYQRGAEGRKETVVVIDAQLEAGRGRALCCAACGHPITRPEARMDLGGQHEHTRVNPHGYIHRFGCFASAPGCASQGVPSRQHTWFPGYWWHIQICGRCERHLGWLFFREDHSFYGLILAELVEIPQGPEGASS